jgi:hypothetical protein
LHDAPHKTDAKHKRAIEHAYRASQGLAMSEALEFAAEGKEPENAIQMKVSWSALPA